MGFVDGFRQWASLMRPQFDCVAGEMTEYLVDALPKGGTTFVYGRLSRESARVAPLDLIYFGKKVEGFLVFGKGQQAYRSRARAADPLLVAAAETSAVRACHCPLLTRRRFAPVTGHC